MSSQKEMGISVLAFSLVLLFVSFAASMAAISVFFDITYLSEALCIVLAYMPCALYLNYNNPVYFRNEIYKPLLYKYSLIGAGIVILLSFIILNLDNSIKFVCKFDFIKTINMSDILYLVCAIIIIPLCEEIIFRYNFYSVLKVRFGIIAGALISTALFSLIHFSHPHILMVIIQSILFTYIYEKSDSILPGIIVHSFNNALWHFVGYVTLK